MTPTNNTETLPVFASEAPDGLVIPEYGAEGATDNYSRGFAPLETLPAAWYNTLAFKLTQYAQRNKAVCDSLYNELKSVITAADIELSPTDTSQLLQAIQKLTALQVATADTLGVVKGSSLKKNVLVNADGTMTVNALADWEEGDGTVKGYVATASVRPTGCSLSVNDDDETLELRINLSNNTSISASVDIYDIMNYAPNPTSVTRATYARFLVNSTSPSGTNYVTADTSRNLKAYTLELS